jgi:hypothetical protein
MLVFAQLEERELIHPPFWVTLAIIAVISATLLGSWGHQTVTIHRAGIMERRRSSLRVWPFNRRPRQVRWPDIKSYSYDAISQHLLIETPQGSIVIVKMPMAKEPLDDFAAAFLKTIAEKRELGLSTARELPRASRSTVYRGLAWSAAAPLAIAAGLYVVGERGFATLAVGITLAVLGWTFISQKPLALWRHGISLVLFASLVGWLIWKNEFDYLPAVIVGFIITVCWQIDLFSRASNALQTPITSDR